MKFIAEFCQNHNGDFGLLAEMVAAAAEAGATYGKIQTIYAENLSYRPEFENGFSNNGATISIHRPYQPEYERLKKLELSFEDSARFVEVCNKHSIVPMTTCFARENLPEIKEAGFSAIKVASYDCASYQLLREVSNEFDEIVVSTGATYDEEVEQAAKTLGKKAFTFLHCVTQYPTPLSSMNLSRMEWLRQFTKSVGLSDHSMVERDDVLACKVGILLGADVIERHFTLLPPSQTKDGPVSITPEHLDNLMEFFKLSKEDQSAHLDDIYPDWKCMIGEANRKMTDEELANRRYYRGRFASTRMPRTKFNPIYNWEETPVR